MKQSTSTQQQTSDSFVHAGTHLPGANSPDVFYVRPNPPTPEDIEQAQFIDKTFKWNGR